VDQAPAARTAAASLIGAPVLTSRGSTVMKRIVATLAVLLLAPPAALRAAATAPPRLITDPGATPAYARASRTGTGVPSIAVSKAGRIWAAWYSGTTPGEIIERCPHAYVVVSTSGDGGRTWQEVLAIDPDGPGPVRAARRLVSKGGKP
jgi:hypothetical protein